MGWWRTIDRKRDIEMKRAVSGRVLVVDDEMDVMTSLCAILSEVGYDVVGFSRGRDALDMLKKQSFDVLLADLDMPDMNGLELLQKALGRDRFLLCFIVTGKGTVQTAIKALGVGAFDVIAKPFTFEVLRMKISRALEVRHLRRGEDMLRCIFENSPEGIYLNAPGEHCVMANSALAGIFGYDSPHELLSPRNDLPLRYVEPGRREKFLRLLDKRKVVSAFESQVFRKDGSTIWISEDVQVVRDTQGRVSYYRGTVRDISGKKQERAGQRESERNLRLWAENAERSKERCFEVIDELCAEYTDLEENLVSLFATLSTIVDGRRGWMRGHSEKVAGYAVKIALEMGFEEEEIQDIRLAALCHDIGALSLNDSLIDKPTPLTEEEYELIKQHPAQGVTILQGGERFKGIIPLVRHHHERVDGCGYPDGLKNDEIPVGSMIIHVAESIDSMTADRPYRPAPGKKYALSELKKYAGQQFDPRVAQAAIKVLSR
jgi:PAS domain S-box-containing protein